MQDISVSFVILSWNTRNILRKCLVSLEQDLGKRSREVICVDNASSDDSADMVETEFPTVKLIRNTENSLYSTGNNQGANRARGKYLCILNSDTEVRPGAIDLLIDFLEENEDYGAAAPRLVNPDGSVQRACGRIPGLINPLLESSFLGTVPPLSWFLMWRQMKDFDHLHSRDVPQPPGACIVMLRDEYIETGGLDPILSLYFNDVDLCKRLLDRGRKIRYISEAEILHHGGFSTRAFTLSHGNKLWFVNRTAYYHKHYGWVGRRWLLFVLWFWGLECGIRIRLGPRDFESKRAALRELRDFMQSCTPGTIGYNSNSGPLSKM
jgi:N-acetylglucosaminyl-diphospho-decaprenol L-rhamnosyltransferase